MSPNARRWGVLATWVLLGLMAGQGSLDGQDATALLERASARYGSLDGLCADFSQELVVPLLGQTTTSRGRMCQMTPHFFRMDFTDPDGDVIVADGNHLWMYLPSAQPGQAIKRPMAASGQTMDFHREFLEDPGVKYAPEWIGREGVAGVDTQHIRLVPQTSSDYTKAEVWLDASEHLIRKIRIEHANGSIRTLSLTALELDPALDASHFQFTPPAGTHVVGS